MFFPSDFLEKLITDTLTGDATITNAVGASITSLVTLPAGMTFPAIRFVVEQSVLLGSVGSDIEDFVNQATGRVRVSVLDEGMSASAIRPLHSRQYELLAPIRDQRVAIGSEAWRITLNPNSEALPGSMLDGAEMYVQKGTVYGVEMYRE